MRAHVLAVGKLREAWVQDGCAEYQKRLQHRLPIEITESRDDRQLVQQIARLPPRHVLWALDERGEQCTSAELAGRLADVQRGGALGLVLVIGGPDGLPDEVKKRADRLIGLSRLTLPHRLVRVLLLEQLYRALSILHDEPYHRA